MKLNIAEMKAYKHLLRVVLEGGAEFDLPYQLVADGEAWFAEKIECEGNRVNAKIGDNEITDTLETAGGLIRVTRRWKLSGEFEARLIFSIMRNMQPNFWVLPGAVYENGERILRASSARGPVDEAACTVPSCSMVSGQGSDLALFTRPASDIDHLSSINTLLSSKSVEMVISIPGESALPAGGIKEVISGGAEAVWVIDGQTTYERKFYIRAGNGENTLEQLIESAWECLAFKPDRKEDWSSVVSAAGSRLGGDFFIERTDAVGFIGRSGPFGMVSEPRLRASAGGGNVEAARALYLIGNISDDRELKRRALDTIDFFLFEESNNRNSRLEYHLARRRWIAPSCHRNFLRNTAGLLAGVARMNRVSAPADNNPRWLYTAKKMADVLLVELRKNMPDITENESRRSNSSAVISGAYIASALLELHRETGDKRYLEAAEWAGDRMIDIEANDGTWLTDAEPAYCREGIHHVLRTFFLLERATGRSEYLNSAVNSGNYLKSLTYAFPAVMPSGSNLGTRKFSTAGAVLPGCRSEWVDPLSIRYSLDMLNLWKLTGEQRWLIAAETMIDFCYRAITSHEGKGSSGMEEVLFREKYFHRPGRRASGRWGNCTGASSNTPAIVAGSILDIQAKFPEIISVDFTKLTFDTDTGGIRNVLKLISCYLNFFS